MKTLSISKTEHHRRPNHRLARLVLAAVCVPLAGAQSGKTPNAACKSGSTAACQPQQASPATASGSPTANAPASASQFAFPVDDSKNGIDPDGTPHSTRPAGGALPEMPTSGVPDPPASSERPLGGGSTEGSSSSSSSDGLPPGTSSASPGDVDDDIAPTTAVPNAPIKSARLKDLGSRGDSSAARLKLEQTRVADDMKVGQFYTKDGNTQGAYLRFKDAADRAPDDPDVRFFLAETANKLQKRDEAVLNYRACLQLDPGGDHDKASRKALGKMGIVAP